MKLMDDEVERNDNPAVSFPISFLGGLSGIFSFRSQAACNEHTVFF